jgi:myo-inositol 2-dehydrogenase/D-chiro-inositol 1-dehydrogenase
MGQTKGLTVGIVGAGRIAQDHAKSLLLSGKVKALQVFDVDVSHALALAEQCRATVTESLRELCHTSDLVWICSPQFTHLAAVAEACRAGKPIFCEKPLAHAGADLTRLQAVVKKAGVPFFMGQSGRYSTVFAKMKDLVATGAVGEPVKIWSIRQGYVHPSRRAPWCFDDRRSGGAIVEVGVHEIDFARWVGGDFVQVSGLASSRTLVPGKCEDTVVGLGKLRGGAMALIDVSWANTAGRWQRGVVGTEGSLFFDDSRFPEIQYTRYGHKPQTLVTRNWIHAATGENEAFRNQVKAVLTALRRGDPPPVTLADGVAAVRTALAIRRAAKTGRVEKV